QDRILIGDAARELSRGAGNPISASIRAKAPEGFVGLSRGLRSDFGELAVLSETADFADLQLQFSVTMSRCVACHGTYRSAGDGP
ncbi:MAG: cytochrome c, partial [Hyphomonas sp.]|nr:cytochrome c [Hyphomonas sp.]